MDKEKVGGQGRVLAALERKLLAGDTERGKKQIFRIFAEVGNNLKEHLK